MSNIYIQPLGTVPGPQSVGGDAVQLAGGLTYASNFVLIVTHDDAVAERNLTTPAKMDRAIAALPEELREDATTQWNNLRANHPPLRVGKNAISLDQPQIMGILNVTPDSFSDGGKFHEDLNKASHHAAAMLEAGAAIIDIGGESTRPGAETVSENAEIARTVPAIEHCIGMGAVVSIDTRRANVMEAALSAGAHIVNDVSALRYDPRSAQIVAASGAPVVLMHAPGDGQDLHAGGDYRNIVFDVFDWLRNARDNAIAAGIDRRKIVLDPGIGFGKSMADNLALMNVLPLFHALGQPLMLGASRKRFIGSLSNDAPADQRLGGSLTVAVMGMIAGCQFIRVHDVHDTVQARNVWRGLRNAALGDFSVS